MNNVRMFVRDAVGELFCYTVADNKPEPIASFRKHAAWFKRYAGSHEGRAALAKRGKYPCAPFQTIVEPY